MADEPVKTTEEGEEEADDEAVPPPRTPTAQSAWRHRGPGLVLAATARVR